jgi:hypothetical protein
MRPVDGLNLDGPKQVTALGLRKLLLELQSPAKQKGDLYLELHDSSEAAER